MISLVPRTLLVNVIFLAFFNIKLFLRRVVQHLIAVILTKQFVLLLVRGAIYATIVENVQNLIINDSRYIYMQYTICESSREPRRTTHSWVCRKAWEIETRFALPKVFQGVVTTHNFRHFKPHSVLAADARRRRLFYIRKR